MTLEVLNFAFVFLRRFARLERAKIPSLARFWILFSGVQAIFARL
jgi:hypothetical protein